MSDLDDKPVIVGAGLTGMLISDRLAEADVPHVLVGDPPDDGPRLGESLDLVGTLELLKRYPEFDEFFYKKRGITVFVGDYATSCNFDQTLGRAAGLRMMGFQSPPELLDVDRLGFDRALYETVVDDEHCTRIESLVETVEYDDRADAVETVRLESGEQLQPSYVFDCTNFVRLLGRNLDVPVERISEPQRVLYTDYRAPPEALSGIDESLRHADHLVRLYADTDGVDGLAWVIPLGSYVSVGISMSEEQDELGADEVLERIEDAYRRRGIDLLDAVDDPGPVVDVPGQQYFIHERAYGRNWLLAGPAYGQFWFPTASGVGTSLVASALADRILQRPEEVGREYQNFVDGLRGTHAIFDRVINCDRDRISRELLESETDRIFAENVKRVARLATMRNGSVAGGVAQLFGKIASYDGVIRGDCEVLEADRATPENFRL